jgi:hypothetical protein
MRKLLPFLLFGSALAAAPLLSSAQQAEYDASVKKTLDKADLK